MTAYYNEHDKNAAAWLRELIKAGLIADGEVDERSIEDVIPSELAGFTQCHFFAGIGVWSYALRQAGWSDNQPVWTGSCPCQPFSAAGKGSGFDDERHLWPAFYHLISQCRPSVVFGEQVASKDGLAWLDLVQADLEGTGYAVGASDICAAGFGAPHIRQRLYWVADSQSQRQQQFQNANTSRIFNEAFKQEQRLQSISGHSASLISLADAGSPTGQRDTGAVLGTQAQERREDREQHGDYVVGHRDGSSISGLADANNARSQRWREPRCERANELALGSGSMAGGLADACDSAKQRSESWATERGFSSSTGKYDPLRPRPTNGFWRDADWLRCRDDKWRSVRPGTFPLVDGTPARVGRLRGYGNAIVAPVAKAFIKSYLEAISE